MELKGIVKLPALAERGRDARRAVVAMSVVALLATAALGVAAAPAGAYGRANWQVAFAGTGTNPATGTGFGFWGWCDYAGGVNSGTSGDCEFAQYAHGPAGSGFTCQESVDLTSWSRAPGLFPLDFFVTGTARVKPVGETEPCLAFFPGSASLTDADSQLPAEPGHYDLGSIGGVVGQFQVTVTQVR